MRMMLEIVSIMLLLSLAYGDASAGMSFGGRRGLRQQFYQDGVSVDQVAALTSVSDQLDAALGKPTSTSTDSTSYAQNAGSQEPVVYQDNGPAATYGTYNSGQGPEILQLHNQYRAVHRAPPLAWSTSLMASAQTWADGLAGGCTFYHSGTPDVGENLAAGYNSWAEVASAWYEEINQYNYMYPVFSEATGHATQMLWESTSEVGCAASVSAASCWQRTVYVCHYSPPGNVEGQFQNNVMPPS